ncbi:hypothetical protein [Shinella sp.]|uniref:hypothetical protein n=1 Tax=Shinella sp. TaxID=1870904 RepID=UPI0029A16EBC|nr:hypothetical protein [Shinella sp.]MDX3977008.1 hypothetical protein [Shinella sp.]
MIGTIKRAHTSERAVAEKETTVHPTYLQPEELQAVKAIFDDIVEQDWFDGSENARTSFARYLVETYSISSIKPIRFRKIAEASARMHYSRKS